jgi:hypothetical protein
VRDAEYQLAEAKTAWESASATLEPEAKAFKCQTNAAFARGLRAHIQQQIEFEAMQQEQWQQLLEVFEQVPS